MLSERSSSFVSRVVLVDGTRYVFATVKDTGDGQGDAVPQRSRCGGRMQYSILGLLK